MGMAKACLANISVFLIIEFQFPMGMAKVEVGRFYENA